MVTESEDQTEGTSQDACATVRSQKESLTAESKVLSSNGNACILKVRKPYTIRKQRERWTEEEHLKFVEALKLYGRAWGQIEEHVGTKSAIQIRSHAQKFFAKVSRDLSSYVDGSSPPVEIPPPRPKKKPLHPYPHQTTGTSQDSCVMVRSLKKSLVDGSKVSPLYGDGYGVKPRRPYTIRKQRERWTEEEHRKFVEALQLYGRAWRQIEEHVGTKTAIQIRSHAQKFFAKVSGDLSTHADGSSSPIEIPPPRPKKKPLNPYPRKIVDSVIDSHQLERSRSPDVSVTKLGSSPQETKYFLGSVTKAEPCTSIKLFGEMVMERENKNFSLEVEENSESLPQNVIEKSEGNNDNVVESLHQVDSSHASHASDSASTHHLPSLNHAYQNIFTLSWCTWWYPYASFCNENVPVINRGDYTRKGLEGEEIQLDNSENQTIAAVDSENTLNSENSGPRRGFFPYKQCLADRDDKLSISFLLEQEGQKARVHS